MNSTNSIGMRFRAARERLGLSTEQAAAQMRVPPSAVSLMEMDDDEIGSCCTIADVRRFAGVLRTTSRELFDIPAAVSPLRLDALEQLIREHCQSRGISFQQFGETVDWPVGTNIGDLPLVLIADICRELGVDWRRVFVS
jgi:transcriptional regulator with XRE-family HTH domain